MLSTGYIHGVIEAGWQTFEGKLWQRSFHDHIIRNETALANIQQYIQENPARWLQDTFNNAL
jgi:putative transposase